MTFPSLAENGYGQFIARKLHEGADHGFDPLWMPAALFDFQASLVEWALRKGRAAILADCGLGKSPMELAWAENIHRYTNKPVLLLTPLAVGAQMEREAEKFGIDARRSKDGRTAAGITITNYEQLHKFAPGHFGGVVCDESSILKSFDGTRRNEITDFMRKVPYRLLATATAAPNDYLELGTSSEALGYMGHVDMLGRFFKNDSNSSDGRRQFGEAPKWRFKGHAETPFWQWVCSWARSCRRPSDLGFDDGRFILPPLVETERLVAFHKGRDGMLFNLPAVTLPEQRQERKRTIRERCQAVADLVNSHDRPALVWCNLNDEGDLLEDLIPDAIQVAGHDRDELKEERFLAFSSGEARVLVTKPKIGAWGLNWQHCSHVTYFPSHSFESYYQAVRRCWRFGQKNTVTVDLVMTDGDRAVMANMQRKANQATAMFARLVAEMNHAAMSQAHAGFACPTSIPAWLH